MINAQAPNRHFFSLIIRTVQLTALIWQCSVQGVLLSLVSRQVLRDLIVHVDDLTLSGLIVHQQHMGRQVVHDHLSCTTTQG